MKPASMEPPSSSPTVEVERLNAEIDRLSANLERASEDIRQVLYAASHDLAEPLQIVLSYAELLSSRCAGGLDETGERYLESIQTGATRIRKLIDGLLAYSRLERHPPELAAVDCSAVVDEALYELATSVERTGATVAVEALPTVGGAWTELVERHGGRIWVESRPGLGSTFRFTIPASSR